MNTTTSTLLAGTMVGIGRIANGKGINSRVVIGCLGVALALSLLSEADQRLAQQFGLLILITAAFTYAVPILKKAGLVK